ncbi:MAG: phospho-sugar mutase [Spirochaetes bacterium]|nr:phospho-sugar mutase [Spirochaetota bacterium]
MRSYSEALAVAESWAKPPFDNETLAAVNTLLALPEAEKQKAILDRFAADLAFGTAGMRAIMDVGTARMNEYAVARTTRAVAHVLQKIKKGARPVVVVGYDGRHNSEKFARLAEGVFLAAGVDVYAFERIVPTPLVPFAVRRLHADGGVMITSSHNAAQYNGYKVYAANGAQISSPFDTDVMAAMQTLAYEISTDTAATTNAKRVALDEKILKDYVQWATGAIGAPVGSSQKIIFTALHGAAGALMNAVFYKGGFRNFMPVPQQYEPNPNFPTVKAPNPENKDSLDMALALAEAEAADLVLATDGDGDRIGVAYRDKDGKFISLTGNQIGTVLLYYLLYQLRDQKKIRPNLFALTSVVSTPLTRTICEKFGIAFYETLTGFKNMGNQADAVLHADASARMVLAFEEAFGVTIGDSRDKDGLVSCLLAAKISSDRGFAHWLDAMYSECGYAIEDAHEQEFLSAEGGAAMRALIDGIRQNPPREFLDFPVTIVRDFLRRTQTQSGNISPIMHIPTQDLLHFTNSNGDWLALRPSGTEPKLKAYFGVREHGDYSTTTVANAHKRLGRLAEVARSSIR